MKRTFYSLFLFAALTGAALASPITLTLQSSTLSTTPGGSVTFLATALNTKGSTENLNADSFSVASPLTVDDTAFFNDWPLDLTATQSFGPAALFAVDVPLGTAAANYTGAFNILGGPGQSDQNLLATVNFTVTVDAASSAAPEPGTMGLLVGALALLTIIRSSRSASLKTHV